MADWNPGRYGQFEDFRLRPALDLLERMELAAPGCVYDLGCGTGRITAIMLERWPAARIAGIDRSPKMLAEAKARTAAVEWIEADIAGWRPARPVDLIFSNAALHWLDDHRIIFTRLMGFLNPGGVLAVQMPNNYAAPSHAEMTAAAGAGPWALRLQPLLRRRPVAEADFYRRLLAPLSASIKVWETEYPQQLAWQANGGNPVVDWMAATALRPLLDAVSGGQRESFLADYEGRMAAAYPEAADGTVSFPFNRLFIVAVK